jgi:uncharacterized membrane protein YdbT with pleckstrin-like domain
VTQDLVQFRTGAFARRLVTVPLSRVQGLALSQTVFDRRLHLASVWVAGAGGGNSGELSNLPEDRARDLFETMVARVADEPRAPDLENPNGPGAITSVGSELPSAPPAA